ncbi:MAG: DUF2804 domain-containing protein [Thermodesulfobacteriota bacterium]
MHNGKTLALIGPDGRPRFGLYPQPLERLNLEDFRPYGIENPGPLNKRWVLNYRIKRWEYLGLCNNDLIFGLAVIRLGYMCNLFAYLFERQGGRLSEHNILTPGGGAARFGGNSVSGEIVFQKGETKVRMVSDPETIRVEGTIKGGLLLDLSFRKLEEPLISLTRVGLKGFNYTHKEAGLPVKGKINHPRGTWDIKEDQSFGVRDYTLGYLARQTFWNWASGGGRDREGNRVGFNLVQGVNETGFTENAFWINGRRIKVDVVDFRYDDRDLMKPWEIESNDGRVRLRFLPQGCRSARTNTGLVVSKFHQPFGRFDGTLKEGDRTYTFQEVFGFTEEHYAKW